MSLNLGVSDACSWLDLGYRILGKSHRGEVTFLSYRGVRGVKSVSPTAGEADLDCSSIVVCARFPTGQLLFLPFHALLFRRQSLHPAHTRGGELSSSSWRECGCKSKTPQSPRNALGKILGAYADMSFLFKMLPTGFRTCQWALPAAGILVLLGFSIFFTLSSFSNWNSFRKVCPFFPMFHLFNHLISTDSWIFLSFTGL